RPTATRPCRSVRNSSRPVGTPQTPTGSAPLFRGSRGTWRLAGSGGRRRRSLRSRFFFREVRGIGLGAQPMHDVTDLELGFAEQVTIFFADQQTRQGQQFVVRLRPKFGQQLLSLRL